MKRLTRILAALLLFSTLLSATVFAEDVISPCSSAYLQSYTTSLSRTAGTTKLQICFNVSGTKILDEIGSKKIVLQRSTDRVSWSAIKTYTPTQYPEMLGSNTMFYGTYMEYTATKGYYYRAYITIWGGKDGGGDSRYVYTNVIDLKGSTSNP